jgi:outer membrane protein OmpA-like peptidoglycan-associated protein
LSEERARAVYDWLVAEGGIDANRLCHQGLGETQLLERDVDEQGRFNEVAGTLNRRVEFRPSERK